MTNVDTESIIAWHRDADGVVTLTIDDPSSSVNTLNEAFQASMHASVERLAAELDSISGVIVTSAKKTFFAGADLRSLRDVTPDNVEQVFGWIEAIKADQRRLETLGKPVVAVLNGTALGGGFELALACHHRIMVDAPGVVVGLPEVTLGLLPGGGGVTRITRMLGIAAGMSKVMGEGRSFRPEQARELGLVDEVVPSVEEGLVAARAWIAEHPDSAQPWDRPGYRMPGGTPSTPALAAVLPAFGANLLKQLKGADYPAPKAILSAAVEGAQVDFDTALRIESRYLVRLLVNPVAKNMINAFFFDLQAIKKGGSRPEGMAPRAAHKVAVLGAGMMGAGIAYACARAGLEVLLKDVDVEAAARGKAYSEALMAKAVARGTSTTSRAEELLARITPTAEAADLRGCDVVIEAVFEDPALKQRVFGEVLDHVAPDALLCSNTSTLPITALAEGVSRSADFIGLHFFSPVDKMRLVEIIRGRQTSQEALARAYDLVLQLNKLPIVVNDSRGFFTSRVIGTFVDEGLTMVSEGVNPVSLERAATLAGYPVGPLQLSDELNLELMKRIRMAAQAASEGPEARENTSDRVVDVMIDQGRPSRKSGAGFYDYSADGRRQSLWAGLAELFPVSADQPPLDDLRDRLLFVEALETQRCIDEGVITAAADANIGSIFGIGYPAWTGGVVRFVEGYPGGRQAFLARADHLADRYGQRFRVPESLRSPR